MTIKQEFDWRKNAKVAYKNIDDKRAYHRQYMKERRELFRKFHLCTECGAEDAYTMAGHPRCFKHTHYRMTAPIEYIPKEHKKPKQIYKEGQCYRCGAPVKSGVTKWGGNPFRVCDRCYQQVVKMGEIGRDKYKETHGETWGQTQYNRYQKRSA